MPKIVEPKVFLIAETRMSLGHHYFLHAIGVKTGSDGWKTDAHDDASHLVELAGKSCYLSFDLALNQNLTRVGGRSNHDYIQQQIVATKHGSVLEHATVTFAFVDVSRVFTHELVRHRAGAAYSQVSGRYVRTDEIGYFLPSAIKQNKEAVDLFESAFKTMEHWSETLVRQFDLENMKDFKLKKILTSAFRRLIGNGQSNHIIATFNHRALRNIIELRTARGAEEEIRLAFAQVFKLCAEYYPALYADAKVEEVEGINEVTFEHSKI